MNDNKIADMWPRKVLKACSFCGTKEDKAKAMIQSQLNNHCICDKCIKQGKSVVNQTIEEK